MFLMLYQPKGGAVWGVGRVESEQERLSVGKEVVKMVKDLVTCACGEKPQPIQSGHKYITMC